MLNKDINSDLANPKIKGRLVDLATTAFAGLSAVFGRFIADETEKWGKVNRAGNIKPE